MNIVDHAQLGLSKLQALPVVGPIVFSPIKITLSNIQMISGFAIGIIFGMAATTMALLNNDRLAGRLAAISLRGFADTTKGFCSLFYACANIATLGILGICVELTRADTYVIHQRHNCHGHGHRRHFNHYPRFCY